MAETPSDPKPTGSDLNAWDIFLVLPSTYVLLMLSAEVFLAADHEARVMFQMVDTPICLLFLGDFFYRFTTAQNRWAYMKWGWVDLLASIPAFDLGRWGRLLRLLRIARAIRSAKHIMMVIRRSQKQSIMLGGVFLAFFLIQIGALLALYFEQDAPRATLTTPQNALWWAIVTVTTVGYGDVYPVTPGGRMVAGMLMFFGIGLFSSIAAVFSSWLVQRDAQETSEDEMKLLRSEIGQLRGEMAQLINHLAEAPPRDHGPPSKKPETEKLAKE